MPPAQKYGNLLIDRGSGKAKVKPASFSHWLHRTRYNCRVCHTDLGFNMKVGSTEITEAGNRSGRHCGACHNGKTAFTVFGECEKCHNANLDKSRGRFVELDNLPRSGFADVINWIKAEDEHLISPASGHRSSLPFDMEFSLRAEWNFVPPVNFSHKIHNRYLDCSSCHPDIFNIKKKGTKDFTMEEMLKGEFCGACHMNVAFPLQNCKRCHSGMTMW